MKSNGRIIVAVTNDLVTDNRVDKVCNFLVANDFEVLLVGRKRKNSLPMHRRIYKTKRMRLVFEKGALFYAEYNIRLFLLLLFRRSTHLLSNDLDTLLASFLVAKLKRNQLFYDTHEYYTEVPELIERPRIKRIWERIEESIFPRLKKVYTVNDSIAERYSTKYNVPVHVVRNVSRKWSPEKEITKEELQIPTDKKLLIVQGAGINIDRGIEEAVEAMKYTNDIVLMIVGDGDVLPQLKEFVKQENLEQKVKFYGKRPYNELMYFTYFADLGLTLDKDTNLNYRFSLPNKVFDYIHTQTPVISSDLPEIRKIIDGYNVGDFIPSHDPRELADFFMKALQDDEKLQFWKKNCQIAANELCWEHEETILKEIYEIR
jgi:glycosyltransferase involved in cell wall biosynthesis